MKSALSYVVSLILLTDIPVGPYLAADTFVAYDLLAPSVDDTPLPVPLGSPNLIGKAFVSVEDADPTYVSE